MIVLDKAYIKKNSAVDITSGCWNWLGYCNPDGYGQRKINKVTVRMHRVSYALFIKPIPKEMQVLHECDNPSCCNPEHLFLGTPSDNMQDMWNKGRHPVPRTGVGSKLTKEQVQDIRTREGTINGDALGREYCVNGQTIRNIWLGVTWNEN